MDSGLQKVGSFSYTDCSLDIAHQHRINTLNVFWFGTYKYEQESIHLSAIKILRYALKIDMEKSIQTL